MQGVTNPARHAELEKQKTMLEEELRARFFGSDRAALTHEPTLEAYESYYRRFKKTYHVQLQLESVLFRKKSLPSVAALVEAMFMAEIADLLLTAGHDLDRVTLPMTLDVAQGTETYVLLRGTEQITKAGDMMITDGRGILSTIIYGPDSPSQITPSTRNVVFTTYAPSGVSTAAVESHLERIRQYVALFAPGAVVAELKIYTAREIAGPGLQESSGGR